MRYLIIKLLAVFALLIGMTTASFALPACPSSGYKSYCFGTYTFANGQKYVGEWKYNKYNGQGTYTFPNGEKYVGEFKDNKYNGQGTMTFANGEKYVGEFKDDKYNGQGTMTFANGEKYVGEFKDNKSHGQGTYTFANGDKYVGESRDGKSHGQGAYTFADGDKYVGEFKNDERHGQGTYTFANGSKKKEGIWKNGAFQYAKKQTSSNTQTATVTCKDDPTLCTVAQLCTKASHYSGGKKAWRKDYNSKKYVTEAKKNGVSCGVQVVVKKEKPVDNKTYKVASGTGFYVSNSGHIITNYHVIDGCKDMKVISQGREIETLVLANDPLNDLALLKAKEDSKTYFSINNKQPEELQDVIVAGFPFGDKVSSSIKFTQGIVSSLTGIGDNYSQMQIDAALQPGNSGGPIMDNRGNVIGVAVAKLSLKKIMDDYGVVPENTNFGIKASAVRNLMVGNSIIVKDPSGDNITKSQLVKLAKEGTVHLTCWMTVAQIEKALKDETGKVLFKEFQK